MSVAARAPHPSPPGESRFLVRGPGWTGHDAFLELLRGGPVRVTHQSQNAEPTTGGIPRLPIHHEGEASRDAAACQAFRSWVREALRPPGPTAPKT
jgi:hypothetical protein